MWIDELSRRRLRYKLAAALQEERYGTGHTGIMEPIHRDWADHAANIVLLTIDRHFEERPHKVEC